MKRDIRDELIRQAIEIRQRSYAPYSKLLVGAALRTAGGKTLLGCSVESTYALATCAERSAVFAAITAGEKQFEGLAIAAQGALLPCAACRQVLSEFNPDLPLFIVDIDNPEKIIEGSLWDLVPGAPVASEKKENGKKPPPKIEKPKRDR